MKWADLQANYSKTQRDISEIKWQMGVLLTVIACAGSSVSGSENTS